MTSLGEDGNIRINSPKHRGRLIKTAAVIVIAVLAGFALKSHFSSDASAKRTNMQPQIPAVVLHTVSEKALSSSRSFIGRVEAIQSLGRDH